MIKLIAVSAVLMLSSTVALAGQSDSTTGKAKQQQQQTTTSVAESVSQGGAGGTATATGGAGGSATSQAASNTQTIVFEAQNNDEATRTRSLADREIAIINADAAERIARINADSKLRNVPSVSGPPLVSSNDTCMGSSSGSLNVAGFGVGAGTTWTDTNCKMLKNSRELWNMGMKAAALALMCTDPANREALELTDFECPQTKREREAGKTAAAPAGEPTMASGERYTDPIVRARLGLPPL